MTCMWLIKKEENYCEYTKALNGQYSLCDCDGHLKECIYFKRQCIEQESQESEG